VQTYRDTAEPGIDGTRAMLAKARAQEPVKAAREVALIRLMFDLGLRRGEVASLDLSDIDREGRKLWIKGKWAQAEGSPDASRADACHAVRLASLT
jgi:integrase/recombinase XerC